MGAPHLKGLLIEGLYCVCVVIPQRVYITAKIKVYNQPHVTFGFDSTLEWYTKAEVIEYDGVCIFIELDYELLHHSLCQPCSNLLTVSLNFLIVCA